MSEREFEFYLKLLSQRLKLTAVHREEIADELRDHLDERMEDLIRVGEPRDEAVARALDEFGDVTVLAAHFTTVARLRRLVLGGSLSALASLATVILAVVVLRPETYVVRGPERVVPETTASKHEPAALRTVQTKAPESRDVVDTEDLSGRTVRLETTRRSPVVDADPLQNLNGAPHLEPGNPNL